MADSSPVLLKCPALHQLFSKGWLFTRLLGPIFFSRKVFKSLGSSLPSHWGCLITRLLGSAFSWTTGASFFAAGSSQDCWGLSSTVGSLRSWSWSCICEHYMHTSSIACAPEWCDGNCPVSQSETRICVRVYHYSDRQIWGAYTLITDV